MNKPICTVIVGIGLLGSIHSAMADDLTDFSSLARDVTALSTGIEEIRPVFTLRDTNGDQILDWFYIEFRVFPGGTINTLLLTSIGKSTALPTIPCTTSLWSDVYMENVKFLQQTNSSRVHVAVELVAECQESGTMKYKETYKTFVYSVDLSTDKNPSVWSYVTDRELQGFDILKDANGNETGNALLTTAYPSNPVNKLEGYNMVMRTVNLTTGQLISETNYGVVRP